MTDLFTPLTLGTLTLPNRVVMAPLTRCRAEDGHVPGALMATYYAQRASAGLTVAEATMAMEGNSAFAREPGVGPVQSPALALRCVSNCCICVRCLCAAAALRERLATAR